VNKVVPILLIVAVGAVVWLLFLQDDPDADWNPEDGEIHGERDRKDPKLLGAEGAAPRQPRVKKQPEKTPEELAAEREAREKTLYLHGVVVAAEGGAGIGGARLWVEPVGDPCPRLPRLERSWVQPTLLANGQPAVGAGVPPPPPSTVTERSGRFRWMVAPWEIPKASQYDVFVSAPGYVTGVLCRPAFGSEVTVQLLKALKMPVRVTDRHRRPLEGAVLRVTPAEGTEAVPGHAGRGLTDREGDAEIDGLLPGEVMLRVDHPAFMPQTVGPIEVAAKETIRVELAPALRLTFEIRSDDGSDIVNPLLQWQTDGAPPHRDVLLLKVTPSGQPAQPLAEVKSTAVRIPCQHRNVRLELKADGFEAWRPEPEPLPVDGGERLIVASLIRDTSLAPLTVKFQDADGKLVSFREMQPKLDAPMHLGGKDIGAITYTTGETLQFDALPSGRYRFGVRSALYAPIEFEVDVIAGEKNERTVKLAAPARLRLRFVASERLMVRFRIVREGRTVRAFPLKADGTPAADTGAATASGDEGAWFGGLPPGSCTVEVMSPELVPTSRSVVLTAGETAELEMEVQKR